MNSSEIRTAPRRALAVIMSLVMILSAWVFTAPTAAAADVWGGSYTTNSGYTISGTTISISSANGFAYIADRMVNGNYLTYTLNLTNDLDMNNIAFKGMTPYDNPFKGTFNGNGHTISNFKMDISDNRVGMFRKADGCTVKDITFANVSIRGTKTGTGVVAGLVDGNACTFSNITVTGGTVSGNARTGGIVGELNGSGHHQFTNCSNAAKVSQTGSDIGGIVGSRQTDNYVSYTNCTNTGEVYGNYAGGIMGWNKGFGNFTDCVNSGYIHTYNGGEAAGIMGKVEDDKQVFTRCRNTGTVTASGHAAGIVAFIEKSSSTSEFYNCENTGTITSTGNCAGGMLGRYGADLDSHVFENCVNRGAVSASQRAGGMTGDNKGHARYTNCVNYANVSATSSDAGGIGGYAEDDEQWLTDCINYGAVTSGSACAGGMIGYCGDSAAGTFTRCFNFGNVTSGNHGGGIIGGEDWGSPAGEVTYCMNWGDVNANSNAGGIVGNGNWLNVKYCFNKGNIKKRDNNTGYSVGGMVGDDSNAIESCYNTGAVRYGDYAGGLMGYKAYGSGIVNSYNAGNISNANNNYQIYGNSSAADTNNYYLSTASGTARSGETAKTAAQLQASDMPGQLSSYFVQDTWGVNSKYPIHKWWRDGYFYFTANFTDGGSTVSSVRKLYNNTISAPTRSKTGYTFNGWYNGNTRVTGSGGSLTAGVTVPMNTVSLTRAANTATWEGSATYTASWTANQYTVTLNNQSATTAGTASVTATYDSAMPSITVPSKTGYTFGGYYTGENGSGTQYYTATGASARTWNIASATTLYAKWTINSYTLTVKPNGGTWNNSTSDQTVTQNYNTTYTISDPARTGYNFTGWTKSGSGSLSGSVYTFGAGAGTVTAGWAKKTYTITWKNADGSTLGTTTVEHGAVPSYSGTPAKAYDANYHYTFKSWSPAPAAATGPVTYTATFNSIGHTYSDPAYSWAGSSCTATRSCSCGCTQTETVAGTGAVKIPANCTTKGTTTYTATFTNPAFAAQTTDIRDIPMDPDNHNYAFDSFVWAEDNTAQAKLVCSRDATHVTYAAASVTSVTHPATCGQNAYTVYTAAYDGHTEDKTVTAADTALTHNYEFDSFVWAEDNKTAQVKVICANCQDEKLVDAQMSEDAHDPTCTAAGYTEYTAAYDGHTDTKRVAGDPATGHTYGTWAPNGNGTHTKTCSVCAEGTDGHSMTADCDYEQTPHAATCTTGAYITYTCKDCGYTYDGEAGQPGGHTYGDWMPNGDGTHTKTCSVCAEGTEGHSVTADCDYAQTPHAATCTTGAYITYTCKDCGYTYDGEAGQPDGHTYGDWMPNGDGTHTKTCSVCAEGTEGHSVTADCDYAETQHPATCTTGAYITYTCKDCGYTYDGEAGQPDGHSYGEWVKNNDGTHTKTCSVCAEGTDGHSVTADCDYDETQHPATCTIGAYITYTCKDCGYTYDGEAGQPDGHAYGEWVKNNDGTHTKTCSVCADGTEGHSVTADCDYEQTPHAATCTTGAYITYVCKDCGYTYDGEAGQPDGHSYGEWTSNNNGTHTKTCSVCAEGTDGHSVTADCDYEQTPHAATCTTGAYITYVCKDCGYTYDGEAGQPDGHSYGEWVKNNDGTHTKTCSVCAEGTDGHSVTANCDYNETPHAATCTTGAYITYTCKDCGYTYNSEAGQPDGHTYGDWMPNGDGTHTKTCSVCAEGTDGHSVTADCDYEQTPHAATCTTGAYITYVCKDCGYTYDGEKGEPSGHAYEASVWTWAADNSSATVLLVCANEPTHTLELSAVITHTEDTATEDEGGVIVYTATAALPGTDITFTDTKTVETAPLGHTHVYGEWVDEIDATCEGTGTLGHYTCSGCGKFFDAEYNEIEDLTIQAKGHVWSEPVFTFSEDGKTATATRTCSRADHPETKTAAVTSEVTKPAACAQNGETTYTATAEFDGVTYTDTKVVGDVTALDHNWGEPVFTFSEDGKTATATRTCANGDHPETKTAAVTSEVTKPAACAQNGETTYTATAQFDGVTYTDTKVIADVAALEHDWSEPVFMFSEDGKTATATRTCANGDHPETKTASVTSEVTKPAACTQNGETTYTAAAEFDGVTYTDTKVVADIAALEHDWSEPVFSFSEDGKTATATRTCANGDHPETKTASVTSEVTKPAACAQNGETTYTATAEFDGVTYTDTKVIADVEATGEHTAGDPVETVIRQATCTAEGEKKVTVKCTVCGAVISETTQPIPMTAHTLRHIEAKAPGCSTNGNIEYYVCTVCGKRFSDAAGTAELTTAETILPATGEHDLTYVPAKAATATQDGHIAYWYCAECGGYFGDEAGTRRLSWNAVRIPATGDAHDSGSGDCPYCGKSHNDRMYGWIIYLLHVIAYYFLQLVNMFR